MDVGVRVVRGPDWIWHEQDGGEGHVGTVVKPAYTEQQFTTINNGTVFVRWDIGKAANYRIEDAHDLRIYHSASATSGVEHNTVSCDGCGIKSFYGSRWSCSVCTSFNLCDDCYHTDQHDTTHQFLRFDTPSSPGVLMSTRNDSVKVEAKGIFAGATVVRKIHTGSHQDDGTEDSYGSVLADDTNTHGGFSHGSFRVLWETGDEIVHQHGKVEVGCLEVASGGYYYRDHLAVLDLSMMSSCSDTAAAAAKDEESDSEDDLTSSHVEITRRFVRPHSLAELLEGNNFGAVRVRRVRSGSGSCRVEVTMDPDEFRENQNREHGLLEDHDFRVIRNQRVLSGNANFQKGDRVQVTVDPDVFRENQTAEYGGWNDAMALCIGLTGVVERVQPNDSVIVRYSLHKKLKLVINPILLTKKKFFTGDSVRILADENVVRNLQKGHGGWVCRMKDMLGKVGTVTQADKDDILKVKFDNVEWMLNAECCKLFDSVPDKGENDNNSDSDDDEHEHIKRAVMQHLISRRGLGEMESFFPDVSDPEMLVQFAADNQLELVQAIVSRYPDKIDTQHCFKTALHMACLKGHFQMVKFLVENGASLTAVDDDGDTSLHLAAYKNHAEILDFLLDNGGDPNSINYKMMNALHVAVGKHSVRCIEVLLKHPVNVNAQDVNGYTPLLLAIAVSCHEAIDMLVLQPNLDFGIVQNDGFTALHAASRRGDVLAVERILSRAPQTVIDAQKEDGFTALHLACLNGSFSVVELLVTKGKANMELVNSSHHTALLCGLSRAQAAVTEFLVLHGANVNAVDRDGDTCLHFILKLLARGDTSGHDPDDLFNALEITLIYSELPDGVPDRQWVAMACFFVRHGAKVYLPNLQGIMPVNLMVNSSIRDVILSYV